MTLDILIIAFGVFTIVFAAIFFVAWGICPYCGVFTFGVKDRVGHVFCDNCHCQLK